MSLLSTIKFIVDHPLNRAHKLQALYRFLFWQVRCLFTVEPKIYRFCENSKILIRKGLTGATGNLYCGLHDFEPMGFLLHFLRKEDLFVDVGANIGSYTILASGEIGADSIAFEPIPFAFQTLQENIRINSIETKVRTFNAALASKQGALNFTSDLDTCNHVSNEESDQTIVVASNSFDDVIEVDRNMLVKIDVEGFETEVLSGMSKSLESKKLKAIIIELMGSGERYGYDERNIHEVLLNAGFLPYTYRPFERELIRLDTYANGNTIYIRDLDFVTDRVKTSKRFKILYSEV